MDMIRTGAIDHVGSGEDPGNTLFPIFLRTERLHVLLVGGGHVALEKLGVLLRQQPASRVTVLAVVVSAAVRALAKAHPHVTLVERPYEEGDLDGKHIAITAVDDRAVSERVHADARARYVPVNVADTPDLCDFYLGAIARKGHLKIAVSTNGRSPTIAKRLRDVLEEELPDELDEVMEKLRVLRGRLRGDLASKVTELNRITEILVKQGP